MANIKISDLTSAASVSGTQQFEVNESGTSKKVTGAQIATYVEGEISSSPTFTGQVSVAAGSAAAPSISVTSDSNTGIYFPAADTVGIGTGGTLRVSVDSSGSLVTTGSIELGHASDTTISRVSAGVIAVEGQTLATQTYVTTSLSSTIPSGTRMLFQQTAAPTGWTKDTSQNDKALRVVSGSVSSGGTVDFSTAFANKSFSGSTSSQGVTGTVGDTTLSLSQIPSHTHYVASPGPTDSAALSNANYVDVSYTGYSTSSSNYILRGTSVAPDRGVASYNGGNGSHTHTFSGGSHSHTFSGAIDMDVKYIDLIIATKN
jgi:hypothetical protein